MNSGLEAGESFPVWHIKFESLIVKAHTLYSSQTLTVALGNVAAIFNNTTSAITSIYRMNVCFDIVKQVRFLSIHLFSITYQVRASLAQKPMTPPNTTCIANEPKTITFESSSSCSAIKYSGEVGFDAIYHIL